MIQTKTSTTVADVINSSTISLEDFYKAFDALRKADIPEPRFYLIDGEVVLAKDFPKISQEKFL